MSSSTPADSEDLRPRIGGLMVRDRHVLGRRLAKVRSLRDPDARVRQQLELESAIVAAESRIENRRASVPSLTYPAGLPVSERRDDIIAAIAQHQVVIVAGETGSGKSTQLPKLCLDAGRGIAGLVGHTQPRRLAARAIAERVAEELGSEVGQTVGYAVRFTDKVGPQSLIKVMTDGILLAEIQRDRLLNRYDAIIVDEAHERSLNIDFILGYLRQLLPKRPDLKVIVTSATLDTERFADHFGGAPVVEVSGRTFPVELRYRPFGEDEGDDRDQTQAILDALEELAGEPPGDVLVFLSGEREIRDTADAVTKLGLPDTEVVPLYARLSAAEQHRVFAPHRGRRIVLATNVAETSLTVPGIRYVVDPGTARISRYSRRTKVQRLPIEAVSQASADQRAGRCGRVAPGVCIRLYTEDDFVSRPEYTEPEILRTNLASVILQMIAIGLGDIAGFPFVDPPDARNVKDGIALLDELGALQPGTKDDRRRLTEVGRTLAQLPLDPRLGRMVIEADRLGCLREVNVIAAALAIQDPRERPVGKQELAREHHNRFAHPGSDFVAFLNLWGYLREQRRALSSSQFRKICRTEYLNYLRVREWQDIHSQLGEITRGLGMRPNSEDASEDVVHTALLAGLLSHVGVRDPERREYRGARDARFALSPGSSLFKTQPQWIMAGELVETTRMWAHVAARIQPAWIERVGAHLLKRTYSEPHWDGDRAALMAYERVTLYGLTIAADRRINYGPLDPDLARDTFIRHALVERDWQTHHAFMAENERLVAAVRAFEDRVRRRDILVDDAELVAFFDDRIPADVISGRHFDGWWKRARAKHPNLLSYSFDMLVNPDVGRIRMEDYPDEWRHGDLVLPLSYEFDHASPTDGVSVHIPLAVLNQVQPVAFDWHIPGRRRELVTALVRSLPKSLRRHFVPVTDYVPPFLAEHGPDDGPLLPVLAGALSRMAGVRVDPRDWDLEQLPADLRITFRIVDENNRTIAFGKDLAALERQLRGAVDDAVATAGQSLETTGQTSWTFGPLPRVVETRRGAHVVKGYPAIVDDGDSVSVRVLRGADEQAAAMWEGTRRLLMLTIPSPRKSLDRLLDNRTKLALGLGSVAAGDVIDDCITAAVDTLLAAHGGPAWDEESFARLRKAVDADLLDRLLETVPVVAEILAAAVAARNRLDSLTPRTVAEAVTDMRAQLDNLIFPGFVTGWGSGRMVDVLRYVRGIERRAEKVATDPARDRAFMVRIHALEARFDEVLERFPPERPPPGADRVHFMIEEMRISFFAQQLGTAGKVSEKRIAAELEALAGS